MSRAKTNPANAKPHQAAMSSATKAALLHEWRTKIKNRPAADRLQWLQQVFGLIAFGSAQRRNLTKMLSAELRRLQNQVASAPQLDDAWHGGQPFPTPGAKLSRALVRLGDGPATRRWTSPLAVDVEDTLDFLTPDDAIFYSWPASPSAVAIMKIGHCRGRDHDSDATVARLCSLHKDREVTLSAHPLASKTEILDSIEFAARASPDETARK